MSVNLTITGDDGEEYDVEVEYTVTSHGSPGTAPSLSYPGDPPEAPEFEIDSIIAEVDGVERHFQYNELSKEDAERIDEAIYEEIATSEPDYPDYD